MAFRIGACAVLIWAFEDGFEFLECPVVSCEECADGLVEDLADLFETELAVVAEFDDLSVGFVELAHGFSERGHA